VSYQTYENICGRCGNIFTSTSMQMSGMCAICYNARQAERNAQRHSQMTSGDSGGGGMGLFEFYIASNMTLIVTVCVGALCNLPWVVTFAKWGLLFLNIPIWLIGMAALLVNGVLTGEWNGFNEWIKLWWQ